MPYRNLLRRPLHHEPSRGGSLEQAKYRNNYEKTLDAYLQVFGEPPPADIWPNAERRFDASQQFVRVSPATTFVVRKRTLAKAVGLMVVAASLIGPASSDTVPLAVGLLGLAALPSLGLEGLTQPLTRAHEIAARGGAGAGGGCGGRG